MARRPRKPLVDSGKPCVDCVKEGIKTKRKTPYPGPRCATHNRLVKKSRRTYSHERHIGETYGISSEEYWAIYEHQGGKCAMCQRAQGIKKKLSVDHDHADGKVRGLLCSKCNRDVLGHARDEIEFFYRTIEYLKYPPAVQVIGIRITPDMAA